MSEDLTFKAVHLKIQDLRELFMTHSGGANRLLLNPDSSNLPPGCQWQSQCLSFCTLPLGTHQVPQTCHVLCGPYDRHCPKTTYSFTESRHTKLNEKKSLVKPIFVSSKAWDGVKSYGLIVPKFLKYILYPFDDK